MAANQKVRIDVVVAVIECAQKGILISLRQGSQHLAGCWEFPGGKVDPGEQAEQALQREIYEELGLIVNRAAFLFEIAHDYAEKSVCLHIFYVDDIDGTAQGLEGQEIRWVKRSELVNYTFPPANKAILDYLQSGD